MISAECAKPNPNTAVTDSKTNTLSTNHNISQTGCRVETQAANFAVLFYHFRTWESITKKHPHTQYTHTLHTPIHCTHPYTAHLLYTPTYTVHPYTVHIHTLYTHTHTVHTCTVLLWGTNYSTPDCTKREVKCKFRPALWYILVNKAHATILTGSQHTVHTALVNNNHWRASNAQMSSHIA